MAGEETVTEAVKKVVIPVLGYLFYDILEEWK
jgi:hypothetical protein